MQQGVVNGTNQPILKFPGHPAVPAWYEQWAIRHATRFGLTLPDDPALIASWVPDAVKNNVTAEEAEEASQWVYAVMPLIKRNLHWNHLRNRIAFRRKAAEQAQPASDQPQPAVADDGVCIHCQGSGWVVDLPDPGDATWAGKRRIAAPCKCDCGQRIADSANKHLEKKADAARRPILTFAAYEARYPNWRKVLEGKK